MRLLLRLLPISKSGNITISRFTVASFIWLLFIGANWFVNGIEDLFLLLAMYTIFIAILYLILRKIVALNEVKFSCGRYILLFLLNIFMIFIYESALFPIFSLFFTIPLIFIFYVSYFCLIVNKKIKA